MTKKTVSERLASWPRKVAMVEPQNDDECPRHGRKYVIRRGTNRCPLGRKRNTNCREVAP